jgi:hypothetical protein
MGTLPVMGPASGSMFYNFIPVLPSDEGVSVVSGAAGVSVEFMVEFAASSALTNPPPLRRVRLRARSKSKDLKDSREPLAV